MTDSMVRALFGSTLRAKAVGWLFSHPDREFYISQIAVALGLPVSNLSLELSKLAAVGLLETRKEGVQRYFRANRLCPIFDELRGIAVKTVGLAGVLAHALSRVDGVEVAFIYGSVASGMADGGSDVDIMVIGEVSFADVIAALEGVRERIGRDITPRVYGAKEFSERAASGSGFFADVMRGEKIFLVGDEDGLAGIL